MKGKRKSKGGGGLLDEQQRIIEKIGERLKALRLEKGHSSYEKFAFENNIDRSQYGKYERGADMRISTLVKVLAALDTDITEFFSAGFED
jgi:transcriptional regulator with XRE-family HTH domain